MSDNNRQPNTPTGGSPAVSPTTAIFRSYADALMGRYCHLDAYAEDATSTEDTAAPLTVSRGVGSATSVDLGQDAVQDVTNVSITTNTPISTALNTPSITPSTTPVVTSFHSPRLTPRPGSPVIKTIYDMLDWEYSPTRPEFVFTGDWQAFGDVDLFNLGSGSAAQPGTGIGGSTTTFNPYGGFPTQNSQEMPDFEKLLADPDFMNWYHESLDNGHLDHVSFSPSNLCTSNNPSAGTSDCIDPSLIWDTLERLTKAQNSFDDDDFMGGANHPIHVAPRDLVPLSSIIDHSDVNNINVMCSNDDDTESESGHVISNDTSDEEDDMDYLDPDNIARHYWYRGDIKYAFTYDGVRYYMTAEQMKDQFGGVKLSLWNYWHAKKLGRIPYGRLIEYLKYKGHKGFFREMVWHLVPRWLQKLLYAARKDGTLDEFVIPDYQPRNRKNRKDSRE